MSSDTSRLLVICAALVLALWWLWPASAIEHPPGVLVPQTPLQRDTQAPSFAFDEFMLEPVADFSLVARVLAKKDYWLGREADLVPVDLALGWGPMSDQAVLDQIDISQSARFYRWRVREFPIPRQEIEHNSANMHLIPANAVVERALDELRVGQVIRLHGQLVNATTEDGWYWRTSTTRTDTGGGACELVYVTGLAIETV